MPYPSALELRRKFVLLKWAQIQLAPITPFLEVKDIKKSSEIFPFFWKKVNSVKYVANVNSFFSGT